MEFKKCKNPACENMVTEYNVLGTLKIYCSAKCRGKHNSLKSREKAKQTMLERHGVEHPMQLNEFKEKLKQTNLERHGVENPFQSEKFREKSKQTCLKNHGVENPMHSDVLKEKLKQTMLERHGGEHPLQLEQFREKSKQTCLKNHGVENPMHSDVLKEKLKQTNLERHGVENPFQSEKFKEKIKQTNLERHGVEHLMQLDEFKEKLKQTNLDKFGTSSYTNRHISQETMALLNDKEWLTSQHQTKTITEIADMLCISDYTIYTRFKQFSIITKHHFKSYFEKQVFAYVESIYPNVIQNDRTQINPYELDIYFPLLNLAIECNGEYWHKEPQKEIDKFNMCKDTNINLYFIWYNDWQKDQEEQKNKIKNIISLHIQRNAVFGTAI